MSRAYISGAKGSNNITLNGCTFDSAKYGNNTSVYSNNPGSINITDCVFNDIAAAVNLNNKSDGLQTVNIQNSTFTNCATKTNADKFGYTAFAAPMRFVTSTSSAEIAVNVDGCTVEYINSEISAGNGDILLGDGREGKDSTPNAALNITKTAAEVQIQTPGEPDKTIVKKVQADETLKITMAAAEEIQVRFVPTADAAVYNLELYADGDVINRLTSADLTFLNASTGVGYEVVKSEGSHVNFQSKGADRYLFYFNGMDVADETDTVITLAQVKLNGYGKVDFKIAEADTNVVNATASDDSIVDSFTVGNGLIVNDKANNGVIDTTLAAATQKLTVNVAFPNEIADNGAAYQAMKVSISGGNLSEAITYNLGDGTEGYTFKTVALGGKSYKAYTVEVADTLLQNTTYTVTIVGAGYRTVRYSVNMQEADKELTFWNNVMDEDTVIEKDNAASTAKVAFLAGDIVKDNNINIYDLSAVASYFGTVNDVAAKSDYAKYDLNRDGKIDSKDVAMVLVSWGN